MVSTNGSKQSVTDHYEILQLMPADGYRAVYCDIAEDGSLYVWSSPIDFLALAKWDQWYFEDGRRTGTHPMGTNIVGMEIDSDGMVYVTNESGNFCGLMKPGGDPRKVWADMKPEFQYAAEKGIVIKEPGND